MTDDRELLVLYFLLFFLKVNVVFTQTDKKHNTIHMSLCFSLVLLGHIVSTEDIEVL